MLYYRLPNNMRLLATAVNIMVDYTYLSEMFVTIETECEKSKLRAVYYERWMHLEIST